MVHSPFNCHLDSREEGRAETKPCSKQTSQSLQRLQCSAEFSTLGQVPPARGDAGPGTLLLYQPLPSMQNLTQPGPTQVPAVQHLTCWFNSRSIKLNSQEITEAPAGGRTEEPWYHSRAGKPAVGCQARPHTALHPAPMPTSHCCLLGRPLLPAQLHHLLNCVMASLLSPSLAHAQPWCRYPAALQAR